MLLNVCRDWKLRPSKLRAEPARAELSAIAELLAAVADRNNKMAIQHANNPKYQPLIKKLSDLEQLVSVFFLIWENRVLI